ncbi:hypothetical protein D6858_05340 [Tsuneonella suprasediminis]|uniref:Uncharacterized protein n=1 Tax=Tsuneonella suprasediminis TaxID=2306996 RepID=A0A419R4J2_9SPHN|nr:hypothetical protein [Tsuneonella suprasediminis]RJX69290.1 hypothetical protein D6858_05340 [Tsuneonella suprasediminis]
MDLTEEAVLDHYMTRFDERTRRAHTVALSAAIATVKDRWPTLELVRRVSNIYGVAVEELAAFFGLIRQPGEREVWVDVFRSPDNQHLVRNTMNAGQRRAYGTMLAMLEVA